MGTVGCTIAHGHKSNYHKHNQGRRGMYRMSYVKMAGPYLSKTNCDYDNSDNDKDMAELSV